MRLSTVLNHTAKAQARLNAAEAKAADAAQERDQWMADAQRHGATYADLEQATGLSNARVTQILRRTRDRATT